MSLSYAGDSSIGLLFLVLFVFAFLLKMFIIIIIIMFYNTPGIFYSSESTECLGL
jgi:hypothetical protein